MWRLAGFCPFQSVPAREWQVMHDAVGTKPYSVTELPTSPPVG